jgi:hypothetical protein
MRLVRIAAFFRRGPAVALRRRRSTEISCDRVYDTAHPGYSGHGT